MKTNLIRRATQKDRSADPMARRPIPSAQMPRVKTLFARMINALPRAAAASALIACSAYSTALLAQTAAEYPSKPVRVLVGLAPGGANDVQTRLFAQRLSETLGRPFVVENRPAAGGVVAYKALVSAPADGYTLLGASGGFTIAPAAHPNLNLDPLNEVAPISLVVEAPFLLLVHPSLPVNSVKSLIALAKAKPGALAYGSAGQGSSTHLAVALFTTTANIDLVHVPYRGAGPALIDVLAGQVQLLMSNVISSGHHAKSGKLRPLAVSTRARSSAFPQLPTMAEAGVPGYEASTWHGWFAPARTPAPIIQKLNGELVKASKAPEVLARLAPDGVQSVGSSPEKLREFVASDIERWRKVIKAAGIRLE
jgi:tripartite-type tricarboxylate transporter receptor subunit TctC